MKTTRTKKNPPAAGFLNLKYFLNIFCPLNSCFNIFVHQIHFHNQFWNHQNQFGTPERILKPPEPIRNTRTNSETQFGTPEPILKPPETNSETTRTNSETTRTNFWNHQNQFWNHQNQFWNHQNQFRNHQNQFWNHQNQFWTHQNQFWNHIWIDWNGKLSLEWYCGYINTVLLLLNSLTNPQIQSRIFWKMFTGLSAGEKTPEPKTTRTNSNLLKTTRTSSGGSGGSTRTKITLFCSPLRCGGFALPVWLQLGII